jgi:hypothetical protein
VSAKHYWTSYWKANNWRANAEYEPLSASGGSFKNRPMKEGHVVYVLSLRAGQLLLGGRMTIGQIMTRPEAVRILKRDTLYDADDWIIAKAGSGTLLHHDRQLKPEVSRQLRFLSKRSELLFTNDTDLDRQTLPRELTEGSASLFDSIIEMTKALRHPITISNYALRQYRRRLKQ